MHAAGGGATDQQRDLLDAEMLVLLHLGRHILHLFQAGRDQAAQADDVRTLALGPGQDLVAGHHHAHIHHFEVVALQHDGDDVLADVVHIALHGGDHDLALGLHVHAGGFLLALLFLDVGHQMRHRLLHHAGGFHHLRQKHLALSKQVADDVHAIHQRAFDHVQRTAAIGNDLLVGLFGVLDDEVGDAVHQRVAQALAHRQRPPFQLLAVVLGRALGTLGDFQQALGGIVAAVQHHVFHALAQLGLQLVVDADHAGVDDAHVHAGLDRVVQEHGVDGLAHRLVAAEGEAHVGDATAHLGARQVLLDPARGVDEVHRVVVVLLDAGGNGEDVGVEDDVFRREAHLIHQHAVGALADLGLALEGVGLAHFVEGHHHHGRAIALAQGGLVLELVQPFLHADGVDDGLALDAAQTGLDHLPLGAVHHDRHLGNVRLAGDQVQEAHHRRLAVQHGLVHVDVDDLCAVLHLLARHGQRFLVLVVQDQARKGLGAGDVGALADVDEQMALADGQRLQAGEAHGSNRSGGGKGGRVRHGYYSIGKGVTRQDSVTSKGKTERAGAESSGGQDNDVRAWRHALPCI